MALRVWPSEPQRLLLRRLAETLFIAALGGAVLGIPRFPAGWLSGAIIAVTIAALVRHPVVIPPMLARVCVVTVGMSLGGAVSPETLARMGAWPASLVALSLAMVAVTAATALYLHYVHGWDALSALFAAAPGALSQTMALASETDVDVRAIAMVQAVRILFLTVGLPLGFAVFGVSGVAPVRGAPPTLSVSSLVELAGLVAASVAMAAFFFRLHVPGGLIVGAMLASGLLHGLGLVRVSLPQPLAIASFVVLGAIIGVRFSGADVWLLRRLTVIGLGALAVGMLVAALAALVTSRLLGLRFGDVVIAYAPGGLEAMTILAFALNLDPVYVAVHQTARFIVISFLVPIAMQWLTGKRLDKAPRGE